VLHGTGVAFIAKPNTYYSSTIVLERGNINM